MVRHEQAVQAEPASWALSGRNVAPVQVGSFQRLGQKHCLLVVLHHITTVSVAHGVLCLATANNNALALHTLTGGSVASHFIFWQRQKLTPLPIMMRIMLVPEVGLEPTATRLKA